MDDELVRGGPGPDALEAGRFRGLPEELLDASLLVFGSSNSGKTHLVLDLLDRLQPYIPVGFLFSPSEPSNHNYVGRFPAPMMYTEPPPGGAKGKGLEALLQQLMDRQKAAVAAYKAARDPQRLLRLYRACADRQTAEMLQRLRRLAAGSTPAAGRLAEALGEELMARRVAASAGRLREQHAAGERAYTAEDLATLPHVLMCPRLLLVFDDASVWLTEIGRSTVLKDIMYRGRHLRITLMLVQHSTVGLPSDIRGNCHRAIFATEETARGFFENATNGFSRQQIKQVDLLAKAVFLHKNDAGSPAKYRKLVWTRNGDQFQWVVGRARLPPPRMVAAPAVLRLCQAVQQNGDAADPANPFTKLFQAPPARAGR